VGLFLGFGFNINSNKFLRSLLLAGLWRSHAFQNVSHFPAMIHFQYAQLSVRLVEVNGGCANVNINRQTPNANTSVDYKAFVSILSGNSLPSIVLDYNSGAI
jgi:hypothetical protein